MTASSVGLPPIVCGIDIITLARLERLLEDDDRDAFLHRFYTAAERTYCGSEIDRLAGRWAAKEAISKAMGTGMQGIDWREIEVLPLALGQPQVAFFGQTAAKVAELHLVHWAVSISHSTTDAIAIVFALRC